EQDHIITGLSFSPCGRWLGVATDSYEVEIWDLRLLRRQLATLGSDWEQPPLSGEDEPAGAPPLRVEVDAGQLKPETYSVAGVLEAEDLPVVSWKDCRWWTIGPMDWDPRWTRLWSNGRLLHCDSRLGSYVELEVSLAKEGPHKLFVYFVKAS